TLAVTIPLGLVLLPQARRGMLWLAVAPAVLCIAVLALLPMPPEDAETTGKTVRLVQPNAPQHQKWDPAFIPVFFQRQIEFTSAGPKPDLVVWPEAALANRVEGVNDPLARVAEAANGAQVALGILRPDAAGFYNSLLQLDAMGAPSGLYDKHQLVPFGEYLPFERLFNRLGLNALSQVVPSGMLAGPGPDLIDFGELGRALPLICYEAVFAPLVNAMPDRADFLLLVTNDAWFGTWSGPYQHLAQAQMRAIEQGLPMLRVANTGVSAVIDPYGRVIGDIPLGQAGYTDLALPAPLSPTIYSVYGETPLLFVVFLWFFALCAHRVDVIGRNSD
ncbi:MAG: apolipoprotein N-acyltransferase, partial [Arenibacterium sp.]